MEPKNKMTSPLANKETLTYWRQRLQKASYSRGGKTHQVRHWSIKIQHQGIRRSIPLATASRQQATERALAIYQAVNRFGWQGADSTIQEINQSSDAKSSNSPRPIRGVRTNNFWKERLFRRSYLREAGADYPNQWSVRFEREGSNEFFPSGEQSQEKAIRFAEALYTEIDEEGWESACKNHPREFTLALFWSLNPITSTYATMLTHLERTLKPYPTQSIPIRRVLIVEPRKEIADSIRFWIPQNPGFEVIATTADLAEARRSVDLENCDLILINRQSQTSTSLALEGWSSTQHPDPAVIGYGLYEDSNQIFRSVSGVNHGYFFRRRRPDQLLAPVSTSAQDLPFGSIVPLAVKAYFQQLFEEISHSEATSQLSLLTRRELEILENLSAGLLDKEIAVKLRISNWTVRNHLKRIYSKLGIHNRTEAVIQYLQK